MKKQIIIALVLALAISLSACASKPEASGAPRSGGAGGAQALSSGGEQGAAPGGAEPTVTPDGTEPTPEPTEVVVCGYPSYEEISDPVEWSHGYASIVFYAPDSCGWELVPYDEDAQDRQFGIRFWNKDAPEETFFLSWQPERFGVCGTGLSTENRALSDGRLITVGYYDNNSHWTYGVFQDVPGSFVVLNETGSGSDAWALNLLYSTEICPGVLRPSEAEAIARGVYDEEFENCSSDFNFTTGEWTISLYNDNIRVSRTVKINSQGEVFEADIY